MNLPRCAARYRTMAGHDQPRRTESLRPTQSRDPIFSDAQSSDRHSSPALWSAIRCGYGRAPAGTLILIFGIIGIFFSLFGAIAWYMGANAMKEIQATGIRGSNESNINTGRNLGQDRHDHCSHRPWHCIRAVAPVWSYFRGQAERPVMIHRLDRSAVPRGRRR